MDFIVEGMEALFYSTYKRIGSLIFGNQFARNHPEVSQKQRLVTTAMTVLFVALVFSGLWVALALL